MTGTIVIPAEHLLISTVNGTQVIADDDAVNETTTLYTVPTARSAYLWGTHLAIKSVSNDFQTVTLRFTDDSASVDYDWVIYVSPWDTLETTIPLRFPVRMDAADTLKIISPDADVTVYATAQILLAA